MFLRCRSTGRARFTTGSRRTRSRSAVDSVATTKNRLEVVPSPSMGDGEGRVEGQTDGV
jgi:hypothetical protein